MPPESPQQSGRASSLISRILRPKRIRRFLYDSHRYHVFCRDTNLSPLASPTYEDISFLIADDAMMRFLAPQLVPHYGHDAETRLTARIWRGEIAIAGIGSGDSATAQLMFFCWLTKNDSILQSFLAEQPGLDGYCIQRLYVPKEFRRKGVAQKSHAFITYAARLNGIDRLWSFIDMSNTANYQLHSTSLSNISTHYCDLSIRTFLGFRKVKLFNIQERTMRSLQSSY